MSVGNFSEIIAVTGKSGEKLSNIIVNALKHCEQRPECNVVWGTLDEIRDISSDVDISMLVTLDFDEYDDLSIPVRVKKLVVPYTKENNFKGSVCDDCIIMHYAIDENRADIVAKNVMHNNGYTSFELLGSDRIGRIKFPQSEMSAEGMLAVAAILLTSGLSFDDVIKGINSSYM